MPRVQNVRLHQVEVPLRRRFRHAAAERSVATNVVCQVTLDDGTVGWGEGVPRDYVTGETPESCFREFQRRGRELLACQAENLEEVVAWIEQHTPALPGPSPEPAAPSATEYAAPGSRYLPHAYWCACEMAIFDAFGRALGFSLSDVVQHVAGELLQPRQLVQYSAVLSGTELWRECLTAGAMLLAGFHYFKAKVGFDPETDEKKVRWLRRTVGGSDLRLDANGAWSVRQATQFLEAVAPCRPSCLEQPIPPGQERALPGLRDLGVPVMLDESVRSVAEAREALAKGWCDSINIRVSKCGGVLASVRMLAAVREAGGQAALGCMVGETGLLSAAGRHLACTLGHLEYLEGSYDRYLLSVQLTEPDITFGSGGWARALSEPGVGVVVRPRVLERLSVRQSTVPW